MREDFLCILPQLHEAVGAVLAGYFLTLVRQYSDIEICDALLCLDVAAKHKTVQQRQHKTVTWQPSTRQCSRGSTRQ